jgi:hypothetical protein
MCGASNSTPNDRDTPNKTKIQNSEDSESSDTDDESNEDSDDVIAQFSFHSQFQNAIKRLGLKSANTDNCSVKKPTIEQKTQGMNRSVPPSAAKQKQPTSSHCQSVNPKPIVSATTKCNPCEIFIGNVSADNTLDDILGHIISIGINEVHEARLLSQRNGKKSFVLVVPSKFKTTILNETGWPAGIRVQLFRDQKAQTKSYRGQKSVKHYWKSDNAYTRPRRNNGSRWNRNNTSSSRYRKYYPGDWHNQPTRRRGPSSAYWQQHDGEYNWEYHYNTEGHEDDRADWSHGWSSHDSDREYYW